MAGLTSRTLRSSLSFLLTNTGWMVVLIFELRSVRRLFTTLAETWSLNGMITRMGGVVVSVDGMCCWSATLESTNFLTAILNRCFGYLSVTHIFQSVTHFPIVSHISKCGLFLQVWSSFPSVSHVFTCNRFLQAWPLLPKWSILSRVTHFSSVIDFSNSESFFSVWPFLQSVTFFLSVNFFSKYDPFFRCDLLFLVWPLFLRVTIFSGVTLLFQVLRVLEVWPTFQVWPTFPN